MATANLTGHDAAASFGNPSPHTRAAHLIVGGLLLLAMALSAYFMVKHLSALSRRASGQAMAGKAAAELLQRHMHGELLGITRTLGEENGAMKAAVTGRLEPDAPEVMAALGRIRRTTQATIVYILNAQGDTVACTPYDGGQTLTGKNYAFRPYFRTAVNGRDVVYPALGITTQKRGLYFSSPIRASGEERPDGAAIGVVVIKKGLEEVDAFFGSLGQPAALLSPEGVVFAGNRPDWLLHPFFPAEEKEADERQFGSNDEQKTLDTVVRPGEQPFQVLAGDRPYDTFISELRLPNSEGTWRLVLLEDLSTLLPAWFQTAVFIVSLTGLCAIAVGCVSFVRRQGRPQTLADNMLAATAVAGLGSLCFLAIYVVVEKWEGNRLTTIFVNKAEVTASLLSSGIKDYLDEIDTLTHFAATVTTPDQEHLAGFAGPLLARKPGVVSVFWAPRQENEPSRADHFPVAQRLPPAAQSFAFGVDLAADERLASLFGAAGDGSLADMSLVPIKDEHGRGHVWMAAVAPVYAGLQTAARPTAASSPAGLMVGVLDMAQALDNIFSNHPRQGMDLRVTDLAAGGEPLPLYSSGSPDPASASSPSPTGGLRWAPVHLEHRVSMRAADRHWEFVATGGAEFIDLHRNRYGSFILIVGSMLTLLAAWYVVSSARRRQQVESLVESRTAQLAESENRVSNILESIQAGVMIIDSANKTIEYVNRAAALMAGREKEELQGQVCHQLICPSPQGRCPSADLCQTVENAEGLLVRKDGSSMPVVKTVKPITFKGRGCCIETFVDITERKAHDDRLAETLQELERFNKVMLAREGRVLELKAEVNDLLVELDRKPVYRTAGAA